MKRNRCIALLFVVVLALLLAASSILQKRAAVEAAGVQAPRFEVDLLWPKPLPNHWLQGQTIGVSVDDKDHIWIIHRAGSLEAGELHATGNPPIAMCCKPAPPILNFDQEGNLLTHWGGPGEGYDWPDSNHGITIDYKGNVWIGGNGVGTPPGGRGRGAGLGQPAGGQEQNAEQACAAIGYRADPIVRKFTQEGKFVKEQFVMKQTLGSGSAWDIAFSKDAQQKYIYLTDGENDRVHILDRQSLALLTTFGEGGRQPGEFYGVHSIAVDSKGNIY